MADLETKLIEIKSQKNTGRHFCQRLATKNQLETRTKLEEVRKNRQSKRWGESYTENITYSHN